MKNILIAMMGVFFLLQSCAEKTQKNEFILKGEITGIEDGTAELVLTDEENRESTVVDSVKIVNGKFEFSQKLEAPELFAINLLPGNFSLTLFLEPGDIEVIIDTLNAIHYDYSEYGGGKGARLTEYQVKGSKSEGVIQTYEEHPTIKAAKDFYKEKNKAFDQEEDSDKKEDIRAEIIQFREQQVEQEITLIDSILRENPKSVAAVYLLKNYQSMNSSMPLEDLEEYLAVVQSPATNSSYYQSLSKIIERKKALLPGEKAPDFTALHPDSSEFTLSSLEGQYVLLDFWASWCEPCRRAIPHWKEVYEEYHEQGLEIVGVTNDSRWKDWFKALEVEKMPWLQVADEFDIKNHPARIATLYDIPSLPSYVLLNKNGEILVHTTSKDVVDEKIKSLFN